MTENALIILSKYPRQGNTKTRLIPSLGESTTKRLAELFLIDLVHRFVNVQGIRLLVTGARGDTTKEFTDLFSTCGISSREVEIFLPSTGSMEGDIVASYSHALGESQKVVLTGSDIPYLSIEMVKDLFRALEVCDLVFHPNMDGGACPHGMKRVIDMFTGTNSRSKNYLEQWKENLIAHHVSYRALAPIFDIDTIEDLMLFYRWQSIIEKAEDRGCFCPETMQFLKLLLRA